LEGAPGGGTDNVRVSRYWGGVPLLIFVFSILVWSILPRQIGLPAWATNGGLWFLSAVLNFLYVRWLGPDADRFTFYFIKVRYWTYVFLVFTVIAVNANANWRF